MVQQKSKLILARNAMKACWEVEVQLHTFLVSALDKGWVVSFTLRPLCPTGKEPQVLIVGVHALERRKSLAPASNQTTIPRLCIPQPCHHTDYCKVHCWGFMDKVTKLRAYRQREMSTNLATISFSCTFLSQHSIRTVCQLIVISMGPFTLVSPRLAVDVSPISWFYNPTYLLPLMYHLHVCDP